MPDMGLLFGIWAAAKVNSKRAQMLQFFLQPIALDDILNRLNPYR